MNYGAEIMKSAQKRLAVGVLAILNAQDMDQAGLLEAEQDSPIANPQTIAPQGVAGEFLDIPVSTLREI